MSKVKMLKTLSERKVLSHTHIYIGTLVHEKITICTTMFTIHLYLSMRAFTLTIAFNKIVLIYPGKTI